MSTPLLDPTISRGGPAPAPKPPKPEPKVLGDAMKYLAKPPKPRHVELIAEARAYLASPASKRKPRYYWTFRPRANGGCVATWHRIDGKPEPPVVRQRTPAAYRAAAERAARAVERERWSA